MIRHSIFLIVTTMLTLSSSVTAVAWQTSSAAQTRERLNGTYKLNEAKSDDVRSVIQSAGNLSEANRRELEELMKSPSTIAVEIRGTSVRLSVSGEAPVSFIADGRARSNTAFGRDAQVRTSIAGPELTIAILRPGRDVTTTFLINRGNNELKMTRRITNEYLSETLFAELLFDRTDFVAKFEGAADEQAYSSNDPTDTPTGGNRRPAPATGRPGTYIVSNGEMITGNLENDIITGVTQDNDRFRMTVIAPAKYKGAVISGYVTGVTRSGRVSGRPEVTLNFETIRLVNGRTYDFAGLLTSITDTKGKTIQVDPEGAAKGQNQTKDTVRRSGIGAGIGAVLGGIIGGGKGAVLGAIIGGGAGAGSVVADGKEDLKLLKGTSITVQASNR